MLLALVATTAFSACSDDSSDALTIYNGQDPRTTARLVSAFEKRTGIDVDVRSGDEATLAGEIAEDGSDTDADVFYSENTPALRFLEIKRLLARINTMTLAKVDPRFQSTAGTWVGVSARVGVFAYNTDALTEAQVPTSAIDLAEPEWKGRIGIAPADTDFQAVVTAFVRTHGEDRALEWLRGIKENAGSFVYSDNAVLTDAINRGQVEVGLVNAHAWFRERAKVGAENMSSAIELLRPLDSGYLLDISGAAVLASSSEPTDAQRFVAFLVSREGAAIIARSDSYEYPLGSSVPAAKVLPNFNGLAPIPLTFNSLGDGSKAIEMLQRAQLL